MDGKFKDATDSMLQRLKEPGDYEDDTDSNSDHKIDGGFVVIIWKFKIAHKYFNTHMYIVLRFCP